MSRSRTRRPRRMALLAYSAVGVFAIALVGCPLVHGHPAEGGHAHARASLSGAHTTCPDPGARLVHPQMPDLGWAAPAALAGVAPSPLPLALERFPAREEVRRPQALLSPSPVRGPPLLSAS